MKIYKILKNEVQIVGYEEQHAKSLAEMWNASKEFWSGDTTVHTEESTKSEVAKAGDIVTYIALAGEKAIGLCGVKESSTDPDAFYVRLLNVHPEYHGKGIGKAFLDLAIKLTITHNKPRIDLYTWAGNTEAMPLYKRMGFFWEDNPSSTHLTNFLPLVETHPLFAEFFNGRSGHELSNREITTKPCGEKVNTFEVFEYSFANETDTLKVGFERKGKRVRMVETKDFKIEMIANQQKLAFGLAYPATFKIENRSGRPLNIGIHGKTDANISMDCQFNAEVAGAETYTANFTVGKITDAQAEYKVHPCAVADVTINGQTIEFGLGIDPKFPLENEFKTTSRIAKIGSIERVHINIKNLLLEDAIVAFELPTNDKVEFLDRNIALKIPKGSYGSVWVDAKILAHGHVALPIKYEITPTNGQSFTYERLLHVELQGFSAQYHYENEEKYVVANGPWKVKLDKEANRVEFGHLIRGGYEVYIVSPELGKPYEDEFVIIKATNVLVKQVDEDMVLTFDLASEKFAGLVVNQIIRLASSGYWTHNFSVRNVGNVTRDVKLKFEGDWDFLQTQSVFAKNGVLTTNHGSILGGAEAVLEKDFTENWLFEAGTNAGVCWPTDLKADTNYGNWLIFEKDFGEIAPGATAEAGEIEVVFNTFTHFSQFRDYVQEKYRNNTPTPIDFIDVQPTNGNPFIKTDRFGIDVINNRNNYLKGQFTLSSEHFVTQVQENLTEDVLPKQEFLVNIPVRPLDGICRLRLDLALEGMNSQYQRALFLVKDDGIVTETDGTCLTVANGNLAFKADAEYADGVFSVAYQGREWLMNKYPNHEPNAYWNPFFGGIFSRPSSWNEHAVLQEKRTAEFVTMADNFGNEWTGIKVAVDVAEFEKLKGLRYENYYMTIPNVPVLACFSKIINKTGAFQALNFQTSIFPTGGDQLTGDQFAYVGQGGAKRTLNMGVVSNWDTHESPLVTVSSERAEKMYVYRNRNATATDYNQISSSNEFNQIVKYAMRQIANGETYTSEPTFVVLTEQELSAEELVLLERVEF